MQPFWQFTELHVIMLLEREESNVMNLPYQEL